MKTVLVTGAKGFIGKNLCLALKRAPNLEVIEIDVDSPKVLLQTGVEKANIVFHLAGINRPQDPEEFVKGNLGFTQELIASIKKTTNRPKLIATSSTQAVLDNPYGKSKLFAEEELYIAASELKLPVYVYRLHNVFGKWCKPFYNSVIATFCHQVSHNENLQIDYPEKRIDFIYVDDIVNTFLSYLYNDMEPSFEPMYIEPVHNKSLLEIANLIKSFKASRQNCMLPDVSDPFVKSLYSTYLSYLDLSDFMYSVEKKVDNRGYLYELMKTETTGQFFVSRTLSGITRGNHYHDTKVEKFCVIDGTALISFRHVITGDVISYTIEGSECKVVDIPPGYTHNIKNVGHTDLITLFWANEVFQAEKPDTYFLEV